MKENKDEDVDIDENMDEDEELNLNIKKWKKDPSLKLFCMVSLMLLKFCREKVNCLYSCIYSTLHLFSQNI